MLESESFDVVLMDLTMPTMGGKEAYIEIHRRWPELARAICTGYYVDLNTWNDDCDVPPPKISPSRTRLKRYNNSSVPSPGSQQAQGTICEVITQSSTPVVHRRHRLIAI